MLLTENHNLWLLSLLCHFVDSLCCVLIRREFYTMSAMLRWLMLIHGGSESSFASVPGMSSTVQLLPAVHTMIFPRLLHSPVDGSTCDLRAKDRS
jgi:hypothetical protein